MKIWKIAIIFAVALAFAASMYTSAVAATVKTGEGITIVASVIEGIGSSRLVLRNNALIKSVDEKSQTFFQAEAQKVVVNFYTGKDEPPTTVALGSVKTAEMVGPVTLLYSTVDEAGNKVATTATAKHAVFDGKQGIATLSGDVKVVSDNPAMFAEPAVMTGEKAIVNLNPNPGPDDFRFRVESTSGVSRIEVTPKKEEPAQK